MCKGIPIYFLAVAGILAGCHSDAQDSVVIESEKQIPKVAILPLIDNSEQVLDWSLSDEFTYTLCSKLRQQGALQIASLPHIKSYVRKMKSTYNPFSEDLSWTKNVFTDEEFVVFLEMVEHREEPHTSSLSLQTTPETLNADLHICLRLRILDLRHETPTITLQELFQDSHFIPRQFTQYNFHQAAWNTDEFALSPVGIAHAQLLRQLKERIEDYILLASKESCR